MYTRRRRRRSESGLAGTGPRPREAQQGQEAGAAVFAVKAELVVALPRKVLCDVNGVVIIEAAAAALPLGAEEAADEQK